MMLLIGKPEVITPQRNLATLRLFHDETCIAKPSSQPISCGEGFLQTQVFVEATATILDDDHKNALRDARSAVSAYARDPSARNAARVQFALGTARELKQTMWREHFEKWLQPK